MNVQQLVTLSLETSDSICLGYVLDLTDQDLMMRPHAGCNHVNWQIGHLIQSEHEMMEQIAPMPALPNGFADRYRKSTQGSDRMEDFCRKEELLQVQRDQREGTLAILEKLSEADLDRPTGVDYAPTYGAMLALISAHWLMHAGQWVIVRRELGRPPLF